VSHFAPENDTAFLAQELRPPKCAPISWLIIGMFSPFLTRSSKIRDVTFDSIRHTAKALCSTCLRAWTMSDCDYVFMNWPQLIKYGDSVLHLGLWLSLIVLSFGCRILASKFARSRHLSQLRRVKRNYSFRLSTPGIDGRARGRMRCNDTQLDQVRFMPVAEMVPSRRSARRAARSKAVQFLLLWIYIEQMSSNQYDICLLCQYDWTYCQTGGHSAG